MFLWRHNGNPLHTHTPFLKTLSPLIGPLPQIQVEIITANLGRETGATEAILNHSDTWDEASRVAPCGCQLSGQWLAAPLAFASLYTLVRSCPLTPGSPATMSSEPSGLVSPAASKRCRRMSANSSVLCGQKPLRHAHSKAKPTLCHTGGRGLFCVASFLFIPHPVPGSTPHTLPFHDSTPGFLCQEVLSACLEPFILPGP